MDRREKDSWPRWVLHESPPPVGASRQNVSSVKQNESHSLAVAAVSTDPGSRFTGNSLPSPSLPQSRYRQEAEEWWGSRGKFKCGVREEDAAKAGAPGRTGKSNDRTANENWCEKMNKELGASECDV